MDALNYLCREAEDFFPHIDLLDCNYPLFKGAIRILYKDRVTQERDFGFVKGCVDAPIEDTMYYHEVYDHQYAAIEPPAGFVPVNAVQILRKYGIEAKGWIHEGKRISYLVVKDRSHTNRNCIAAIFPQMTPWKFKDKPLTDWEKRFLVTLLGTGESLADMMQEYIDMNNIPQKLQGAKLDKLISGLLDAKLQAATTKERNLLDAIRQAEESLNQFYQQYTEVCNMITGIQTNHSNDDLEDFKDAFISNPNCHLTDIRGTTLNFYLTGFVTNFSEHKFKSMTQNERSHLFDYAAGLGCNVKQMRELYNELFLGQRYRLNVYGGFSMNCSDNTISLIQRGNDGSVTKNAIPNPHIFYYACKGSFAQDYAKAFAEHDYLDVLDTALSEVSNVNWTDISPMSNFAEDICCRYNGVPCVWDKQDKVFITPKELAERMKANEQ